MNVLLVTCSFEDGVRCAEIQPNSHYPIGLASIHAYLESKRHNVKTLFLNDYPYDDCLKAVEAEIDNYDVLGLQILSHNRVCSYRAIEAFSHKIRVVVGGIHASLMYEQIIERYPQVVAVLGEGEETFAELLGGGSLEDIRGIAYMSIDGVARTPDRPLIDNLDALPIPKHEAFFGPERTVASILTSRGCPFRCSFCSLDAISRRKARFKSVDGVIAEILHLKRAFPHLRGVWIHDDSFFLDNERAVTICDLIAEADLGLKFICSGRFKPLSERLVHAMERARFIQVLFGLESGCQRVLDRNGKAIKQYDAIRAFELFKNSPIRVTAFLIVGLPGEDDESVAETWQFVNYLQSIKYTHYEDIGVLMVYPGTEVYELMKKAGKMDDSYWMTDQPVPLYTAEHDEATLYRFKDEILDQIALDRCE